MRDGANEECWISLLSHLNHEQMCRVAQVSRKSYSLFTSPHFWPQLAITQTAVAHRDGPARLHLIHLYAQLATLYLESHHWEGLVGHDEYEGTKQWDQYDTLDCARMCSEVLEPGKTLQCRFPAVPPGKYRVALVFGGESDERRYCSVQTDEDLWLRSAFNDESVKIWDYTTSSSLQYEERFWNKQILLPEVISLENFSAVTVRLHRPSSRAYGGNDLLPDSVRLVPSGVAEQEYVLLEPDYRWSLKLPLSGFHVFTARSRAGRARNHFSISPRTHSGFGRALCIHGASNVEYVGLFRNVPLGRFKVSICMRGHVSDEHWSSAWLSGVVVRNNTKWNEILGEEPWVKNLDKLCLDGAAWSSPHCWGNCCTDTSEDRNEWVPPRGIISSPMFIVGAENGLYIDAQRNSHISWQHFESNVVEVVEHEVNDVLVTLRVAFAGRGDGPMAAEYFALRSVNSDDTDSDEESGDSSSSTQSLADSSIDSRLDIREPMRISAGPSSSNEAESTTLRTSDTDNALVNSGPFVTGSTSAAVESPVSFPPKRRRPRLSRSILPDRFWHQLFTHLSVNDIINVGATCVALRRLIEQDALWAGLIRRRTELTVNACKSKDSMRQSVLRLERLRRSADDLPDRSKWQCMLICHDHAARGYRSPCETMTFHFRLPVGHYQLCGIMDCKFNIRDAYFEVRGARKLQPISVKKRYFSEEASNIYELLHGRTMVYNETILTETCQMWNPRDTFCVTSYQEIEVSWGLGWDVVFEDFQVLPMERPVVEQPCLVLGDVDSAVGERRRVCSVPLLVTPLSFHPVMRLHSLDLRERFPLSRRSICGSAVYVQHDRLVSLRAILPDVAPGAYEVFFSLYCHKMTHPNPGFLWKDALFWTYIELEAGVVAPPRTPLTDQRDAQQAEVRDDNMVGLPVLEGISYPALFSEETLATSLAVVRETVTRSDCVAGWNQYVLKKPLFVPQWPSRANCRVHLNIRLVPEGAILLDTCGLRPIYHQSVP